MRASSSGLGIDQRPVPLLALLMPYLTQGLLAVQVEGDVEWTLNRTDDGTWIVTLLNNRGTAKPQHGMTPTDHTAVATPTIRTDFDIQKTEEWLAGEAPTVQGRTLSIRLPAGALRVVALTPRQ